MTTEEQKGVFWVISKNQSLCAIDKANPHTIKKFELIEEYVKGWSQKLLNYTKCNGIVFIDCMCNSGVYTDDNGGVVYGTPIRVSLLLSEAMKKYPSKQANLYFNDLSPDKIALLREHLPKDTDNFHIHTSSGDGNAFLKRFRLQPQTNFLLVYDPYEATIDWDALEPFLNSWGEVIINHMVHDTIRGIPQAKNAHTQAKYEETYKANFSYLLQLKSNREAYEKLIFDIIKAQQHNTRKYYVSSFPFFNRRNNLVYKLIYHTSNIAGFKLFKTTAWKIFGGKSSSKNTYGSENQLVIDLSSGEITTNTDEYCYNINDIAKYLLEQFKGRANVPFKEIYSVLEEHPVFPSEGFRPEIKDALENYSVKISKSKSTMTFPG